MPFAMFCSPVLEHSLPDFNVRSPPQVGVPQELFWTASRQLRDDFAQYFNSSALVPGVTIHEAPRAWAGGSSDSLWSCPRLNLHSCANFTG
jgi:hypothetical protein